MITPGVVGGQTLQGACRHTVLEQQVVAPSRRASTIRTGLTQAETVLPPINDSPAELAEVGVCTFEYEGPTVSCRPTGSCSHYDDSFIICSAALALPGGIGAVPGIECANSERAEHFSGELTELRSRFVARDQGPGPVKARAVSHTGKLLHGILRDVWLIGSERLVASKCGAIHTTSTNLAGNKDLRVERRFAGMTGLPPWPRICEMVRAVERISSGSAGDRPCQLID